MFTINIQGGITAIYAAEKNYKVEAVMAINPTRKVSSNEKRQSKRNPSQTFASTFFAKVLDEACEKEQERDIHIFTHGYTKDALPYYNYINMREYC